MTQSSTIDVTGVDHIGIRVADAARAMDFYSVLGFEVFHEVGHDAVVIIKNPQGVEINLVINANNPNDGKNILMDVGDNIGGGSSEIMLNAALSGTYNFTDTFMLLFGYRYLKMEFEDSDLFLDLSLQGHTIGFQFAW